MQKDKGYIEFGILMMLRENERKKVSQSDFHIKITSSISRYNYSILGIS